MHTCWSENSHSCHGRDFFIGQAKIQGAKTIPPTLNDVFCEILAFSPPCVDHAEVTRGYWLGNLDEAGGGDGLSGIDPQCAHCAERSVPAQYPWQPNVDQPNCGLTVCCRLAGSKQLKLQYTYSASGNLTSSVLLKVPAANVGRGHLTIETPGMVAPSERESRRGIASLGSDANEPRSLRQLF